MMTERVALVGAGALGGAVAERLSAVGYEVHAFDPDPKVRTRSGLGGVEWGSSIESAIAECRVVLTCLPDGRAVEEVTEELAGHAQAGTVVVDLSTVLPSTSREAASKLARREIDFVDAPVGRTTEHARRGQALALLGGKPEVVGKVRGLVDAYASDVIYCGLAGAGSTAKLLNNILALSVLFGTLEVLNAAEACGLDRELMASVLGMTNARNGHLETTVREKVLVGDFAPGFAARLGLKDARLAMILLSSVGAPVFVGLGALSGAEAMVASGRGEQDVCGYYAMLEALSPKPDQSGGPSGDE